MEEIQQDEQPIIVSSENIQELLASKNFKQRILAYQNIHDFPQYIGLLQNETLAVAVEAALDALLKYDGGLKNEDICGLYIHFNQSKATIKTKLSELIDKVYLNDKGNVLCGISQYFTHKTPKVVSGCVNKMNALIESDVDGLRNKDMMKIISENVCSKLETLFSNNDKTVRSETSTLSVTLYKIFFEDLLKYIENINPIILKELKETAFKKIEIPMRVVKINDDAFEHPDWKERLAAMSSLKETISNMSNKNEIIPILSRKTRDPNLNVVIATVECIRNGKIVNPDCVRGILERFKDKKSTISALIKETIQQTLPDINILIDMLSNKNPDIKVGVVECLKFYTSYQRIGEIGKLLEDSSADVRKVAVELLSKVDDLSELNDAQISKIKKSGISSSKITKESKQQQVEFKSQQENRQQQVENRYQENKQQENRQEGRRLSVENTNNGDQAYFTERYPQLFDKDWNKRVACISENKVNLRNEGASKICSLLITSKETNFNVLKDLMDVLGSFDDLSEFRNDLSVYLSSKITELKLKESIIELFVKIGREYSIKSIIQNIHQNKVGKKFVASVEILSELVVGQNSCVDEFIQTIKVFGMQEKRVLNDFITKYRAIGQKASSVSHDNLYTKNNAYTNGNGHTNVNVYTNGNGYTKDNGHANGKGHTKDNTYKNDNFSTKDKISSEKSLNQPKNESSFRIMKSTLNESRQKGFLSNISDIFTPEFIELIQKDTYSAVEMLERMDVCSISDVLIVLYCQYNLPSPYFNSLILHLISRRYILSEKEAQILTHHLLGRSMDSELDLMDRIYPATKLYRILRSFPTKEGLSAIFNLMKKYKNLEELSVRDIEIAVTQNEDFIAFSFDIDKIIGLKREMKERLDNVSFYKDAEVQLVFPIQKSSSVCNSIIQEKVEYQNVMQDDDDIDDIEDSIIIERSADVIENQDTRFSNGSPSVIYAPTVADRDSLLVDEKSVLSVPKINDDSIIIPSGDKNESICISNIDDDFIIPPSKIEDSNLSFEIERSLENISISTTPVKKKRNFSELDGALSKISEDDVDVSVTGFSRLTKVILEDPESIVLSSNSVISAILVQLMSRYDNLDYRAVVLNTLLKFTQNVSFCANLRYETLKSIHKDLVPLVKDNNHVADILINLCLNCELHVLDVYFDLLEDANDVLMKLIWRHSKKVKFTSAAVTSSVIQSIDSFYVKKAEFLSKADNIVIKVCLLHLKECVAAFSDNLKQFGIGIITEEIINLLIASKDLNIDDIRNAFKGIQEN